MWGQLIEFRQREKFPCSFVPGEELRGKGNTNDRYRCAWVGSLLSTELGEIL
jgi:hypothetical protein